MFKLLIEQLLVLQGDEFLVLIIRYVSFRLLKLQTFCFFFSFLLSETNYEVSSSQAKPLS